MSDGNQRMPVPSFEAGKDELRAFWNVRGWIENNARSRLSGKAQGHRRSPHEAAIGFLKRQSYELIIKYIKHGDVRTFERAVRYEGRPLPSQVRIDENPFHFGLLALFPTGTDYEDLISRQDRSAFALQMLYASRHRVPPRLLTGFLYQTGSLPQLRERLKEGFVEEGFERYYNADIWAEAKVRPRVGRGGPEARE